MRSQHVCTPWVVMGTLGFALVLAAPAQADDFGAWSQLRIPRTTSTGHHGLASPPLSIREDPEAAPERRGCGGQGRGSPGRPSLPATISIDEAASSSAVIGWK